MCLDCLIYVVRQRIRATLRSEDSAHVGAIGLALEPLTRLTNLPGQWLLRTYTYTLRLTNLHVEAHDLKHLTKARET